MITRIFVIYHLGNVRVGYVKDGNDLKIMDRNDYYPFGMSFLQNFGLSSVYDPMAIPYNYKFGTKELQESGFYDFGARMYMPDIGRWGVIDPLTEKSRRWSPYTYAYNNPIHFIDPDGRDALGWGTVHDGLDDRKLGTKPDDWVQKGNQIFFDSRVNSSNVTSLHGEDAKNIGSNPTFTSKNANGDIVDNLSLNENGSITDNNTGNDLAYTTSLGGTTISSGEVSEREDTFSFYADGNASLDVGPQLRASGEFMGTKLGVSTQNTISNKDIENPGNPNTVQTKSFGLQIGAGAKYTTESVRGNIINQTLELNLIIGNVVIDNNYVKINVSAGAEVGALVVGGSASGEAGIKIKK